MFNKCHLHELKTLFVNSDTIFTGIAHIPWTVFSFLLHNIVILKWNQDPSLDEGTNLPLQSNIIAKFQQSTMLQTHNQLPSESYEPQCLRISDTYYINCKKLPIKVPFP